MSELLLYDFLKHLQQTKTEELNKIQYELQMINEDCKQVEDTLETLKVCPILILLDFLAIDLIFSIFGQNRKP